MVKRLTDKEIVDLAKIPSIHYDYSDIDKIHERAVTTIKDVEAQLRASRRLRNVFAESNKKLRLEIADLKRKNDLLETLLGAYES